MTSGSGVNQSSSFKLSDDWLRTPNPVQIYSAARIYPAATVSNSPLNGNGSTIPELERKSSESSTHGLKRPYGDMNQDN